MTFTSVAELIHKARDGRNQKEFARELKVSQGNLSKYEGALVNPPVRVIEYCIRLVNKSEGIVEVSVDELAEKVRRGLRREDQAYLRSALSKFIDGLAVMNQRSDSG